MWRTDSFDKTLMLGKIEGGRRGRQRMRWLDGITDSMGTGLGELGVGDGQGGLAFMGSQRVRHNWATELNWQLFVIIPYNVFLWISCYFSFYFWYWLFEISLLFMMNLKSLFNLWWIRPKVYQFYLFREWDLRLLDLFYFISLYFIYFCSNLYRIFPSTNSGICLFFLL